MLPNRTCPNSSCPNRGILTLDANSILYLAEGAIRHARTLYPDLTNAGRLPHVSEELDSCLKTIEGCCSLDGALHVSDLVFYEEVLDVESKGLIELKKYSSTQRRQILQVLQEHFPQPRVTSEHEIQALCSLFNDPSIRPLDRDASLIVVACQLAMNEKPVIVLTSDPDFTVPLNLLMRQGSVTLGGGTFSTSWIMHRHYFHFIRRLHECCNLSSEVYRVLGDTYLDTQLLRLEGDLKKKTVGRRILSEVRQLLTIHTKAIQYKCTVA